MWAAFLVFVLIMLSLDILAFGGSKAQKMGVRQAAYWSLAWVCMAMLFAAGMWAYLARAAGIELAQTKVTEFLAGYVIEKALSIDNIFVFLLIFNHFSVPAEYQRKVLLYGVLGAIVMRIGMILGGVWVVEQFSWVLYGFGAFLIFTGLKMIWSADKKADLNANPVVRLAKKYFSFTDGFRAEKFSVLENGRRLWTPLLLVLVMIEVSDVIFAVDSIPAVFAITTDPFIVFTSNIFAIMGLRALYFLLADIADRFHYLKYGLALVLIFVGGKMLAVDWFHISTLMSLLVIGVIVAGSVLISLLLKKSQPVQID
jgi:tellurite resistance protein TerC